MSGNIKAIFLSVALSSAALTICPAWAGQTAGPPAAAASQPTSAALEWEKQTTVSLPGVGTVDVSKVSLPMFTLVIAALDGFNPCAFFVLFFLLSLMIHARSRRRMLLIGGVFVFISGAFYFLFMSAWLNLFLLVGKVSYVTLAAGAVALIVSLINIKDFFFFKEGVSVVIPDGAKLRLFTRMRGLLKSTSLLSMAAGTAVLATAANTYELLCTAGFPMVFTRVLTLKNLSPYENYLYLVLYNVVYVVPLAGIVIVFTLTLGARKLTEWEGRKLKLLSGVMMFSLGLILLIRPAVLNNALAAALLLGTSLAVSGVVILVAKKLRPGIAARRG